LRWRPRRLFVGHSYSSFSLRVPNLAAALVVSGLVINR
jgi:hypothetical protein